MPRKPRIEIPGYYHIINRGVEQRKVFQEPADYEYYEELMCFYTKSFVITLHNYCLMFNHYHLLQELKTASSLVEAPNVDNRPSEEDLQHIFKNITEIKERNIQIAKVYKEGYPQHMIAKVLGMAQSTISAIIKRMDK